MESFHEAFVAVNALGDMTVRRFDTASKQTFGTSWQQRLLNATEPAVEAGATRFLLDIQQEVKSSTVDGKLETPILIGTEDAQVAYLGQSLLLYAEDTVSRVQFIASTGQTQLAYIRGFEGRLALSMFEDLDSLFDIPGR
ncbi:MAG: hypothetical protein WDN66_05420 [Candidatus Saccharibacteria bacterium]